jgi:chromosome segregation ATPase
MKMDINESAVWTAIAIIGVAVFWGRLGELASESTVRDLRGDLSSLKMAISSVEGSSDRLRRSIDEIDSKIEGLAIAVYSVSDRLDRATNQIDADTDDRHSTGDSLHERLDNIERLIHELADKLNTNHRELI